MPRKGERDLVWEALAELFYPGGVSPCVRGLLNKAREELRYKTGVTPQRIREVYWKLTDQWDMPFKPMALVLHWDDFAPRTRYVGKTVAQKQAEIKNREFAQNYIDANLPVPDWLKRYAPETNEDNGQRRVQERAPSGGGAHGSTPSPN